MKHSLPNLQINSVELPRISSRTKKIVSLGIGLACLTTGLMLGQSQSIRAQQVGSDLREIIFTAMPPRTEVIKMNPGETQQISLELRNGSTGTAPVYVEVRDFIISDDGKTPLPLDAGEGTDLRWSLANWITVLPASTELLAGQTANFDVVISAPEDALPGGHYAMILYSPNPVDPRSGEAGSTQTPETAAVISGKVGTLVYVEIAGDIHEEAFVRSFTAPTWVEYGPVELKYVIENLSDIHISPQTSIVVRNWLGQIKEEIAVQPQNVFPYATRDFEAQFDQTWGIGPYTAQLTMAYGNSGKIATASVVFWILPYRVILAVLVLIAVMLTFVIAIRRHLLHRNDDRSQHIDILEDRIRELEERLTENDK